MVSHHHTGTLLVAAAFVAGCSDWTPIRDAHDVEGQTVKVERAGKAIMIDEVVACDEPGFVIAKQTSDCREGPPLTFDTRREKTFVHDKETKSTVGLVVVGIVAAILLPAAIVGTIYLRSGALL